MTKFTYSGIIMRRDGVGYGVLTRERQMSVVLAVFDDQTYRCLSTAQAFDFESASTGKFLEFAANSHATIAFNVYCENIAGRFVPEMTAYIRGLSTHHKAAQVDPDCVRNAIVKALKHEDPFRAAVSFETCIPYLLADERLVVSMRDVLREARRDYNQKLWLKEAALVAENELVSRNGPIAAMIRQYRQSAQSVGHSPFS